MKIKVIIIFLIITIAVAKNIASAADYYHEMGMDPFYSSLNPAYINEDESATDESLVKLIKRKKAEKAEKKKLKEIQKELNQKEEEQQNTIEEPQEQINKTYEEPVEVELNLLEPAKVQPKVFGTVKDDKEKQAIKGILPGETPDKPIKKKKGKDQFVTAKYKDNADLANQLDKEEKKKERDMLPKDADPFAFLYKYLWPFHKKEKQTNLGKI